MDTDLKSTVRNLTHRYHIVYSSNGTLKIYKNQIKQKFNNDKKLSAYQMFNFLKLVKIIFIKPKTASPPLTSRLSCSRNNLLMGKKKFLLETQSTFFGMYVCACAPYPFLGMCVRACLCVYNYMINIS